MLRGQSFHPSTLLSTITRFIFLPIQYFSKDMPSYDDAIRVQALAFKIYGATNAEIEKITGIK
jgi:hypothetical protein